MASSIKELYTVRYEGPNAGMAFTVSESMTGLGLAHETGEGDDPFAGSISPGYSKSVTVYQRTYSIPLTFIFTYHNKYPDQEQNIIRGVAASVVQRMNYDLALPFTYCTSTAATNIDGRSVDVSAGDSLALAYASHTLRNSSSTYRNIVAAGPQLSSGALELAENLFTQNMLDNNGNRLKIVPDAIVLASDKTTFNVARKLIESTSEVSAGNSGVYNPYNGAYKILRVFEIDQTVTAGALSIPVDTTKSKQWMLVCTKNPGAYLIVTQNPTLMTPTFSNGGVNYMNGNKTWHASAIYEPVVLDPRNYVISTANGNG